MIILLYYKRLKKTITKNRLGLLLSGSLCIKTPFGAFESYFYGLGSTVTHKKFFLFDTQKLPKNREFLAWDLFCNIDMELVIGFEPTAY